MPKDEFLNKVVAEDADEDFDEEEYDLYRVQPDDIDLPPLMDAQTYAKLFDVPENVGKIIADTVVFGKKYAQETGNNEWAAMPFRNEHGVLESYLVRMGYCNEPILLVNPPRAGFHVCLTKKGLERLVEIFPSENYKQKVAILSKR